MPMMSKDIMRIIAVRRRPRLAGIARLSGRSADFAIGGYRPLENYVVREIVDRAAGRRPRRRSAASSSTGARKARRARRRVSAEAKQKESDEVVLKDKMKDALATLKARAAARSDYLYDLPWYVLIGPPGSGKTTALVNSGLKFPLSRGATPAAVAGVGGTRYCDWWFTEDAVLIDTAGRYTTQDSDAKTDQAELARLPRLCSRRTGRASRSTASSSRSASKT